MACKKGESLPSGLYKTWKVVSLLINIGGKLKDFLLNSVFYKNYFQMPRTAQNRSLGEIEFCTI